MVMWWVLSEVEEDGFMLGSIFMAEAWRIHSIDTSQGVVQLNRIAAAGNLKPPPRNGNLRMWGMFGQICLDSAEKARH